MKIPSHAFILSFFFSFSVLLLKNISFDLCFTLCECVQWFPVLLYVCKSFFISDFRSFNLSGYSGVMSAETEANGSVVCLSLTYYLQPNSGAIIKVLIENEYNEVTVGTATAPLGDIKVMDGTFLSSVYTVVFELYYVWCICVKVHYVTNSHTWSDYTSSHLPPDLFLLLQIAAFI